MKSLNRISVLFRITLFVVAFHISGIGYAQNQKAVDSLLSFIKIAIGDIQKVNALNELSSELLIKNENNQSIKYANEAVFLCNKLLSIKKNDPLLLKAKATALDLLADGYNINNPVLAIEYYNKALLIWQQIKNYSRVSNDLQRIADAYYYDLGNNKKALLYYHKCITILTTLNDKKNLVLVHENIARIYFDLENINEALKHIQKSLSLSESINDSLSIASLLNLFGQIYSSTKNYNEAIKYFNKSLSISEKIQDSSSIAVELNNIGDIFERKGDDTNALVYYNKSLFFHKKANNQEGIALAFSNIGGVYERQNNLNEALKFYFECSRIMNENGDKEGIVFSLSDIAGVFLKKKKYKDAEIYGLHSFNLAKNIGYPKYIFEATKKLNLIYEAQGNYKEAYKMHKLYKQMSDSINNGESINAVAKYESEKEILQLKQNQTEKEASINLVNQKKLEQKNYWIYGSLGLLLIVVVSAAAIYKINKQKQKAATLENIVLEQKLLRTQMNPHFIFNILASIQNFIYKDKKEEAHTYVGKFAKLMRSILENSREEFVSMEKEMKTLEHYLSLNQLLLDNKFNFKIDIDKNIDIEHTQIPPMLAQPFIENALKHGIQNKEENGFIKITFKQLDNRNIQFEVEDNGIGFTKVITAEMKEHKSFATVITQERLVNLYNNKNVVISMTEVRNKLNEIIGTKTFFTIPYRYT